MRPENFGRIGNVVNDRYEILSCAGSGATGEVFVAQDRHKKKQVAIKYLKWIPGKPEAVEQFKSEFATLTHLSHPHIAKVYDFEHDTENNLFLFTSELIEGIDFVKATRGLTVDRIEDLFVQTLRALEYLHGNQIYHFDIKSANVLVGDCAKIIDFGLATIRFQGHLVGTPSYMAPEMIQRENPDGRADLYSLGVLVYFALTGENPFRAPNPEKTLENQLKLVPPPPSTKNQAVPPHLDGIIMRLLEKRPQDRYQTAAQAITDFNLRSARKYAVETLETQASYIPLESKFIGRLPELEKIMGLLNEKIPQVVIVRGGSGSGKSRFMNEVKYLAQVSGWETSFLKEPSKAGSWQKSAVKKHAQPLLAGIDDYDKLLSEVCGYKIGKACETLSRKILAGEPVIMVLSADKAFEAPKQIEAPAGTTTVSLQNFSADETKEYLTALTGMNNPPKNVTELLLTNTAGNPFVLTEVVKSLISEGMLIDSQGRWKETTFEDMKINLGKLKIEESLEKRLLKDFAELASDAKTFTEMLAVIGRPVTFHEAAIITGRRIHPSMLTKLIRDGFLRHDALDSSYFFSRPMLAKIIYSNIPVKIRKIWHDRIAAILCRERQTEECLYHVSRGSNAESAKKSLSKLIDTETASQKNHEAIANALFFLEKWPEPGIRLTLARLYNRIGKYDDAIKSAGEVMESGDQWLEVSAQTSIGIAFLRQMKFEEARQNFVAALQLAADMPLPQQLRIQNFIAETAFFEGNLDKALEIYERTDKMAEALPKEDRLGIKNNSLGEVYFRKKDYQKAIKKLEKDLELYKETGDVRLVMRIQYVLAESFRMENLAGRAEEAFNALIERAKSVDDMEHLFRAYNGLGNLYNSGGFPEKAAEYYERALDISSRLQMDDQMITCVANLGIIRSNTGDLKKAREHFSAVLSFIEAGRAGSGLTKEYHGRMHLELGEICRTEKKFGEAKGHLFEAKEIAEGSSNKELLYFTLKTLAKTASDEGDEQAASNYESEAEKLKNS